VARDLSFRRVLAQGGDKKAAPVHAGVFGEFSTSCGAGCG
jgi:hypothetical protein